MSFIPSPSKSGGRTEADATPQAMGLAMNGYEIRNALEFLAPERTPEQMRHRLVIELHSEAQEIRCPESGLYARHERLPEDIAIYLVDHEPAQVLPTQGMAPYDENDPDLPSEPIHIPSLVMNGYQLQNALEFLAPDDTPEQLEYTLVIEHHEKDLVFPEAGLYAYHDECPEEGAILLRDLEVEGPADGGPEIYGEFTSSDVKPAADVQEQVTLPRDLAVRFASRVHTEDDVKALHDLLERKEIPNRSSASVESFGDTEREDMARIAFETAMANGINLDSFMFLANSLAARYDRIIQALREEVSREHFHGHLHLNRARVAEQARATIQARLAALENQAPVAVANRGLHAFWVKWTEAANHLYGPGLKLYAASGATSEDLLALDKQCRDDVARAMGLTPSEDRGFAWSFLLAAIKKLSGSLVLESIKTAAEAAIAQQAVQDGIDPSGTSSPV